MEVINICPVRFSWCAFNEGHWITSDGAKCDLGDNLWDMGDFGIIVGYSLINLEIGAEDIHGVLS